MKITQITVSYGRTQSLESYCNVRPEIRLSAELAEGDDPQAAQAALLAEAKTFVNEQIDVALEDSGQVARYSREPRYRLIATRELYRRRGADSWGPRARVDPPEKLLLLLPEGTRIDTGADEYWWTEPFGATRKLRLSHARQRVADYLNDHDGTRLIDCSDGDLSRVPSWVFAVPDLTPLPAVDDTAEEVGRL